MQIIANGRRFSKTLLTLPKKRLFCTFYSQKLCFANRLAGSLPSNFLKIFKNFSGWNVRFVLAECLDRLGKRSDRLGTLGSSSQNVLRILNISAEYYGILRILYTIFLKLYIFKSRSYALRTSVCRLYDTEFMLDTNAINCYHKFDHRVDREERLVFVRRLPANRPFTGGFLMSGFFAGSWGGKQ